MGLVQTFHVDHMFQKVFEQWDTLLLLVTRAVQMVLEIHQVSVYQDNHQVLEDKTALVVQMALGVHVYQGILLVFAQMVFVVQKEIVARMVLKH